MVFTGASSEIFNPLCSDPLRRLDGYNFIYLTLPNPQPVQLPPLKIYPPAGFVGRSRRHNWLFLRRHAPLKRESSDDLFFFF